MSVGLDLAGLAERHQQLEQAIDEELHNPGSDSLKITKLKREKLKVKEQIEGIIPIQTH